MVKQFKYLVENVNNPHAISLEEHYSNIGYNVGDVFVVAEEYRGYFRYLAFEGGVEECLAFVDNTSAFAGRSFHEVLLPGQKQKLRVDIDVPPGRDVNIKLLMEQYMEVFAIAVNKIWNVGCTVDQLLVTTSSGDTPAGFKHSYHVILPAYCVVGCEPGQVFIALFTELCDVNARDYVDCHIYKQRQNFRMYGFAKQGSERRKVIATEYDLPGWDDPRRESILGLCDTCEVLPNRQPIAHMRVLEEDEPEHVEFVRRYHNDKAFSYSHSNGRTHWFKREAPSFCTYCNRTHHNDNTMYWRTWVVNYSGRPSIVGKEFCIRQPRKKV